MDVKEETEKFCSTRERLLMETTESKQERKQQENVPKIHTRADYRRYPKTKF